MTQDNRIAVLSVIELIVENNAGCVARKLKDVGYNTKNFIPAPELKVALVQLHDANRDLFYKVMRTCEWHQGNNNWTNNPLYRDKVLAAVETYTGQKVDKTNWWITTINYLQNQK